MNKNIINKHLVAAACGVALASAACQASEAPFIGPSIGLGISTVKSQIDVAGSRQLTNEMQNLQDIGMLSQVEKNPTLSGRSTMPMLDLSYGFPLSDKFVGTVGINYDLGTLKSGQATLAQQDEHSLSLEGNLRQHVSIYVAPGVRISDKWLAYAKGSYHQAKGTLQLKDGFADSTTEGNETLRGFGYGIGTAYAVSPNLEARFEVEQVKFNSKKTEIGSFNPKMTRANLILGYRF